MTLNGRRHWSYLILVLLIAPGCAHLSRQAAPTQWYKGNTHTHTLWSDGDAAPEIAVAWYADRDYNFLSLSDHDIMLKGKKWVPIRVQGHLPQERVDAIRQQFGNRWVKTRMREAREEMRLKTLKQLKRRFDKKGQFLLMPAQEITANSPQFHLNGINLRRYIQPVEAQTKGEAMAAVFDAIDEQSRKLGVPMIGHLDHPNWDQGVTAEEIIAAGGERFFEVYNGHGGVRNWGDETLHMQPVERLWDIILSMRYIQGANRPMYGMATDDTHDYFEARIGLANAGRGWIMVKASKLTDDAIINALKAGDFYGSSGVTLDTIDWDGSSLRIHIAEEPGVTYRTEFVGTSRGFDSSSKPVLDDEGNPVPDTTRIYSPEIGRLLSETEANPAVYRAKGDELYVRARIVSSKIQANPHREGDLETAWTQPIKIAK